MSVRALRSAPTARLSPERFGLALNVLLTALAAIAFGLILSAAL